MSDFNRDGVVTFPELKKKHELANQAKHTKRAVTVDVLKEKFSQADTNNDGFVSLAEYSVLFQGKGLTALQIKAKYDKSDLNGDGKVSLQEKIDAFQNNHGKRSLTLRQHFDLADTNNDGLID